MKIIILTFIFAFLLVPPAIQATPFSGVDSPIAPIKPITPIKKIEPKKEIVEPITRKIIAQKIQILADNKFMITPKESPLTHGTISPQMLGAEVETEAPQPKQNLTKVSLKANLIEDNDGNTMLRLKGRSVGTISKWQKLNLAPKILTKNVPLKPKIKKIAVTKLKDLKATLKLHYSVDNVAPNGNYANKLAELISRIKGQKITHLNIISQSSHVPLADKQELPRNRWQYMAGILRQSGIEFKGIRTSEIILTNTDNQFTLLEIRSNHK